MLEQGTKTLIAPNGDQQHHLMVYVCVCALRETKELLVPVDVLRNVLKSHTGEVDEPSSQMDSFRMDVTGICSFPIKTLAASVSSSSVFLVAQCAVKSHVKHQPKRKRGESIG